MRTFTVTVADPDNEDDNMSPTELEVWLAEYYLGRIPFEPDSIDGFGVVVGDGSDAFREDNFGSAEVLAASLDAAAERLMVNRTAAVRSSYDDYGFYLVFIPEGDSVRLVKEREGPPGRGHTYRGSSSIEAGIAFNVVQAWLDSDLSHLLQSTGSVTGDRTTGRLLRLDRGSLVADLRRGAELARAAAQALMGPLSVVRPAALPLACPPSSLAQIRLLHIPTDYPRIDLLRAIRATADLSLDAAKAVVAKVLAGQPVILDCPTEEHRRALIAAGATVE
jgi:hypothetical protein